jgi:hypothetical protein
MISVEDKVSAPTDLTTAERSGSSALPANASAQSACPAAPADQFAPQPLMFLDRAWAEGMPNLEINHGITPTYEDVDHQFIPIINPQGLSGVFPTWFPIASFASDAVEKGLRAAAIGRHLLADFHGLERPSLQIAEGDLNGARQMVSDLMDRHLPRPLAIFLTVLRSMNLKAFLDLRTLVITEARFVLALLKAPGRTLPERMAVVFRSMDGLFAEGNQDIYSDIGAEATKVLELRQNNPDVGPQDVVKAVANNPINAQRVFDFALGHLQDRPRVNDFTQFAPADRPESSKDLVAAGLALYFEAGKTPDLERKNDMIALGNNLLLFREQRDIACRTFNQGPNGQQISHPALMKMLTPAVLTNFGDVDWTYLDYEKAHPDGKRHILFPQITTKNWAVFADRWNAIMDALEKVYADPHSMDRLPTVSDPPDPRTPAERGLVATA